MKTEDAQTSAKAGGDISPIAGSMSNAVDTTDKPAAGSSTPSKHTRKSEPSFEVLKNFSRVTPAQMASIAFPPDSRYQPVRAVSTRTSTSTSAAKSTLSGLASEKYAGGGGILIMIDHRPHEEADYLEFETHTIDATAVAVPAPSDSESSRGLMNRHISLDEDAPEADPPESFEVS